MIEIDAKHAETLLAMAYSYRRIAKECEGDITTDQAEAVEVLRDACRSAEKARLRV